MRSLALIALVLAGCLDDSTAAGQPETITDQSGAVFGWECDEDSCAIKGREGSPELPHCEPPSHAFFGYTWGDFMDVTPACTFDGGWGGLPGASRLLVCETDADCPTIFSWAGVDDFVCHAGFCRNAEYSEHFDVLPTRWTMILLCFGDRPRSDFFDDPALTAAIEAACPGESINSPCLSVPEGCPDPRG